MLTIQENCINMEIYCSNDASSSMFLFRKSKINQTIQLHPMRRVRFKLFQHHKFKNPLKNLIITNKKGDRVMDQPKYMLAQCRYNAKYMCQENLAFEDISLHNQCDSMQCNYKKAKKIVPAT